MGRAGRCGHRPLHAPAARRSVRDDICVGPAAPVPKRFLAGSSFSRQFEYERNHLSWQRRKQKRKPSIVPPIPMCWGCGGRWWSSPSPDTLDEQLYALRHERHRLPGHSGDRRLQALPPEAAVHHVQDGAAERRAHQVRQHRGPDHAASTPTGTPAIYETMVRLARGYEALLHPFVDCKGNFGKVYSRDMA